MSYLLPGNAPQSRLPRKARCDLTAFPAIQSKRLLLAAILGLSVTSCDRAKEVRYDLTDLPSQIEMEGAASSSVETADAMQHLHEFDRDAAKLARFRENQTITYEIDAQVPQTAAELIESILNVVSYASRKPFTKMDSPSGRADVYYTIG